MKVIDLLNKIANGNIPTKIKYDGSVWEYSKKGENYFENDSTSINWDYVVFNCLNDEIEIIEDNKKIEKLEYDEHIVNDLLIADLYTKINEIIDRLNSGDK